MEREITAIRACSRNIAETTAVIRDNTYFIKIRDPEPYSGRSLREYADFFKYIEVIFRVNPEIFRSDLTRVN